MMAISEEHTGGSRLKAFALSVVLGLLALAAFGAVAGVVTAMLESNGASTRAVLVLAAALAIGLGAIWGVVRLRPWAGSDEPVGAKTRKANQLVLLSGVVGALLGGALSIGIDPQDPFALLTDAALPPALVIPTLVVWLVVVPLISWQWHRSADEHELRSYQAGGIAALYLYAFLAPAWWLAWRGGLAPEPASMGIFLLVMAVWGLGWFWRRNR